MDSINLINNALLVTPTEADNFDYDIVPLPPPPDFQDDVTDNPPTPDYIDNDNQDNMSVINLNKSSLTPDNLSQFIFRNTKSSKILSPCIQEFSKENKNEKSTLTKNKEELNRKPLDENDLSLMSDKQDVRPMQEAMIHSTPIVEAELTRETLGFSPITAKKSQKMGMIETAETAKYTPLSILTTQTPQKQNLFTSTPRQKSIWNYVKPSRSNEETAPSIAKTKPCIACTRLTKEKTKLVSNLTNKKLATYNPQFNETVTHMIVMANKENCVKDYTIKFVSAVAAGIWVLRFEWIEECLSKNCIVPEVCKFFFRNCFLN